MNYAFASIAAAGLLIGTATAALAQDGTSPGASGFAPGHQERAAGDRGASASAPGQLQKLPSGQPGDARRDAPGQQTKASATTAKASVVKPDTTKSKATRSKTTRSSKATGSAPVKGATNPLIE